MSAEPDHAAKKPRVNLKYVSTLENSLFMVLLVDLSLHLFEFILTLRSDASGAEKKEVISEFESNNWTHY